jgi:hypothetical protein
LIDKLINLMDSLYQSDLFKQETHFFLKNTFLIPRYLSENKYNLPREEEHKIIKDVKNIGNILIPKGLLNANDAIITEKIMTRCFDKCKKFVLEDWIDFDELDCTMKCTLVHKKSAQICKDAFKEI